MSIVCLLINIILQQSIYQYIILIGSSEYEKFNFSETRGRVKQGGLSSDATKSRSIVCRTVEGHHVRLAFLGETTYNCS